jgi:hypothetical protein
MRTGRPKAMLTMFSDERTHLLAITRSRSLPAALTLRAKIVLACEREPSNAVVATRLGVGPHTISKSRFVRQHGLDGNPLIIGKFVTHDSPPIWEFESREFVQTQRP